MAERTVTVSLIAKLQGFTPALVAGGRTVREFRGELDQLATKHRSGFNDLTVAAAGMGAGLAGAFMYATRATAQFDKQMSEVGSVADATGGQLDQLRQSALQAGKDTAYSATEAASAEAELAKAGMSTADILGGGLTGALDLAAAGQMDLADAATISAQVMNVWHLRGDQAAHIADVLAAAANKSAADMHGLGMSFEQVGLVAVQAGWSFEQTTATLAAFADRGLKGSDGATSLKTALTALMAPTDKSRALMAAYGIEVYDAAGKMLDNVGIAGQLRRALAGVSDAERNAALSTIFGSDAIRAANVLFDLGEDGVRKYNEAVDNQGAAAKTAAEKTNNLSGDVERLTGSLETLAITSGSSGTSGLRVLVQAADALVTSFATAPPAITGTLTVLAGVAGAAILAGAGVARMRQSIADATDALDRMGPVGQKAGVALSFTAKWAGRATVAFVGLQIVNAIGTAMASAAPDVDQLTRSMQKFAETGEKSGEMARLAGKDLDQFADDIKWFRTQGGLHGVEQAVAIEPGFMAAFDGSVTKVLERVKAWDAALAQMAKSGHSAEAARVFDQLADAAARSGVKVDDLRSYMPAYTAAAEDAAKATDAAGLAAQRAAAEQKEAADKANLLAGGWAAAVDKGKSLADVFDLLNGKAIGWAEAELRAQEAADKLGQALDGSNGSLDIHTKAGQDAKAALLDLVKADQAAIQAKYDETQSVTEANALYEQYRAELYRTMRQAGLTKDAAEALIATYFRMPPAVATTVTAPGATTAHNQVADLDRQIRALTDRQVRIDESGAPDAEQRIRRLQQQIDALHDKQVTLTTIIWEQRRYSSSDEFQNEHGYRWGGVTYAATGALRDANVYAAGDKPTYGFAEKSTGGEAFIPRLGDLQRSRGIAEHVVRRWLGGTVAWNGGGMGGGGGSVETLAPLVLKVDIETIWQGLLRFRRTAGKSALGLG
ncbi:phage tail tape measure protein [Longispora fulva]|uniref:TP901 family phage tail tape measure protein n=1 Tax=Longispora fulva TaxID=619741 RepID=A0A8J7KPB3_9ACTN|nr:phage tail tape measure protein [Longispora fulva]MBG6141141.1 TP901 family phage tail tape measure protein [Longispora fulva]GIG63604.1 phage tail tape measure protein [Longispora fulva]